MAQVPVLRTWTAGLLSTASLNADVRGSYDFLLRPPMAVARASNVSKVPFSDTIFSWHDIVLDRDSGFSSGNQNYICKTPGYYHMTLRATVKNEAATVQGGFLIARFHMWFNLGTTQYGMHAHTGHLTEEPTKSYTTSAEFYMNLNDQVSVRMAEFPAPNPSDSTFDVLDADWVLRWVSM